MQKVGYLALRGVGNGSAARGKMNSGTKVGISFSSLLEREEKSQCGKRGAENWFA